MTAHLEVLAFEKTIENINKEAVSDGLVSRNLPYLQRPGTLAVYHHGERYLLGSELTVLPKCNKGLVMLGEDRRTAIKDPAKTLDMDIDVAVMHYKVTHRYTDCELRAAASELDRSLSNFGLLLVANKPPFMDWKWLENVRRWHRRVISGNSYYRRSTEELISLLNPLQPVYVNYVSSEDDPVVDSFVITALAKRENGFNQILGCSTLDLDRAHAV